MKNSMSNIEVNKIIEPIVSSDGAGVKLKRSIGVEPNYYDPFLMLDEFGSENKDDYIGGFPPHPHRGIETVTYMLHGEFEHEDSTGGKGRMKSGDVQWMKTGSGIIHSEMPAMSEGKLQGFQLWINMPSKLKMTKPEYIYLNSKEIKFYKDEHKKVKVIAGKFEKVEGPIKGHNIEPIYFDVELKKDKEFFFNLPLTHNSLLYLVSGNSGSNNKLWSVDVSGNTTISGNVGIGTASPNRELHVIGQFAIDNSTSPTADNHHHSLSCGYYSELGASPHPRLSLMRTQSDC